MSLLKNKKNQAFNYDLTANLSHFKTSRAMLIFIYEPGSETLALNA